MLAHAVDHGDDDVVEAHLVEALAVEGWDRGDGDAAGTTVDDQHGQAARVTLDRAGATQHPQVVGAMATRGPALLAVEHVVITMELRACAHRGEVGACLRLGVAQ